MRITMGLGALALLVWSLNVVLAESNVPRQIAEAIRQANVAPAPDWWRSLGTRATPSLIKIYQDDRNVLHRVRLLEGMAYFNDAGTAEFLKAQAKSTRNSVLRTTAIRSVARSRGLQEEAFFAEFLKHPDAQTRYQTADALRRIEAQRAREIVDKFLKEEKTAWVIERLRPRE